MNSFTHILIPLDGSRLAEAVLPVAFGLASRLGAKITLLHVLERGAPSTVHGEPHLRDTLTAGTYLEQLAQRHALPGLIIEHHVHRNEADDVARSIVEHAQELGADLIALTPHGSGGLRRLLLGSIAQIVLQGGLTPVLLVPSTGTDTIPTFELRHILVPIHGHTASEAVLPLVHTLSERFGAAVRIVQVVPTRATVPGDQAATALLTPIATASALEMEQEAARQHIATIIEQWNAAPRPSGDVLRGEPAQVLIELINRERPDLVAIATHGRAGIAGIWAGSVAAKIAGRSTQPLLMIRVIDTDSKR